MSELQVVSDGNIAPANIATKKTACCAVALGVAIVAELVGKDISNVRSENSSELMATMINNELKI